MVQILYEDDHYRYQVLSNDTLEGGLEVMRKSFFLHESVSIAVELHKHPNAIKELEELSIRAANDGVSVVAIEKKSGQVIGVLFNKLQVKGNSGDDSYFERFAAGCKEPSARALIMFMMDADDSCDLFGVTNADCILELMFLATLKEHWSKGVGTKLCEVSIELGKALLNGNNLKESLTGESLPLDPRPKAVTALFTSFISEKIGKRSGFVKALEIDYNRWSFNGKTFAERIGPKSPCVTVGYKCL